MSSPFLFFQYPVLALPLPESPMSDATINLPPNRVTRKPYLYGTHLPALLEWLFKTDGPVLEIGAGSFSTPILAYLLDERKLVTVEPKGPWLDHVSGQSLMSTCEHHFCTNLDQAFEVCPQYDVILVDGPMPRNLKPLKGRGKIIVVHDTNDPQYGYDLNLWEYRHTYKDLHPWTTVLSDEPLYPGPQTTVSDDEVVIGTPPGVHAWNLDSPQHELGDTP